MSSPRRFRGYIPKTTTAVYGSLVERRSREYYIYTDAHEFVRISNRHICLATGLTDVHGTELYEEDMVRRLPGNNLYQIQYHHAGFWLVSKWQSVPITDSMLLEKVEEEQIERQSDKRR